ncbi:uncharacterized protein BCR38DRAFT_487771 [Pseudomassariella vexata]|uniref:Uncharacterized protein n=1 Tax=Pseudomassariella vexata TaxID=1141098 RepID=A0A1Y2DNJ3_9PEZI|nr:uncharacterized protein BCR38DRAFT_487771 [Pseudomassariella vexata]ORY60706.1 hypothetical protein BCR38DRAFT_487771 [Pseudomassariella vexata]
MSLLQQKTNSSTSTSGTGETSGTGAHRSPSEGSNASSPRKWAFGAGWKSSRRSHDKNSSKQPSLTLEPRDFPGSLSSPDLNPASSSEANYQTLRECVQKLRSAPAGASHVDAAFKEYSKIKHRPTVLCKALLRPRSRGRESSVLLSPLSNPDSARESSFDTPSLNACDTRASFSSRSLTELGVVSSHVPEQYLAAVRDWRHCLESLLESLKTSLLETYKEYEPNLTPTMIEQLFNDKSFRKVAIQQMRNASIFKLLSAHPDFFLKYDIRFRNYDKIKLELVEIRHLLQAGESGISPDRTIEEIAISPRGDVILEFANSVSESYPVFRFRVLSHMLAETGSPYFVRMFNDSRNPSTEILPGGLPPQPSRYICRDGSEVKLYRMPQLELNTEKSIEILMHAAHNHHRHEEVPREIEFSKFVAIAEVCMRYQCTSPLELVVEHCWLPQWIHKASDGMPDGLLLISYAFGLRRLFTRLSKSAILNIADEKDLQSKLWPQKIKDTIWAVRQAKIEQVTACCSSMLQEYLHPPSPTTTQSTSGSEASFVAGVVPTAAPRCPKGSHFCDAASLGWLMMVFAELQLLPHIMHSVATSHLPPLPQRSLNQVVDCLRVVASPPHPQAHRGVCDFAPAFRGAINDIYNSVVGLTLFDVSGKHGWALSMHKIELPQPVPKTDALVPDQGAARRGKEEVALRIMCELDTLEDLQTASMIDKCFHETYQRNQVALMKALLRRTSNTEPRAWAAVRGDTYRTAADAERILWPEGEASSSTPPAHTSTSPNGTAVNRVPTEKFRATDVSLQKTVEDKSLLSAENKHLRETYERKIGHLAQQDEHDHP